MPNNDETFRLEEKARTVLEDERIVISDRAFEEFMSAITAQPEPPSEKLLAAVRLYNQHEPIASGDV